MTHPLVTAARSAVLLSISLLGVVTLALLCAGRDLSDLWFGSSIPFAPLKYVAVLMLTSCAAMLTLGPAPRRGAHRHIARVVVLVAGLLALADAALCVRDVASHRLHALSPVTFSLALGVVLVASAAAPPPRLEDARALRPWVRPALVVIATGLWTSLDIAAVAFTDYRRRADAIVVLGAGVHADGTPSEALAQRMATACDLYRDGYAPRLIVSGGHTAGLPSEPDVMRHVAIACGVPDEDIIVDDKGRDTEDTATDTADILGRYHPIGRSARDVLVVSHGYHLARARLAMERAGLRAFTVPAVETRPLRAKPYYLVRELAAWMIYAVATPNRSFVDDGCG